MKGWFVCKCISDEIYYLDRDKDLFYSQGVGFASQKEAQDRAARYSFHDKSDLFIVGPRGRKYPAFRKIRESGGGAKDIHLARFKLTLKYLEQKQGDERTQLFDEFRTQLNDFVYANGIWCMRGTHRTKEFFEILLFYSDIKIENWIPKE